MTKGYDKYLETGIQWIGKIPIHWKTKRVKHIGKTLAGGTPATGNAEYWDGEIPWLNSGKVQNNIIHFSDVDRYITQLGLDESATKIIKANSVLVALTGATCANIGFLTFSSTANQSVVAIENDSSVNPMFLFYFLLSQREQFLIEKAGGAQSGINEGDVKNLSICLPTSEEQVAIINYLDDKTSRVDKLIFSKQELIEILKEERIAITNTAVTKGLNAKVKMKPSGVEWIGDIPEHWKVTRVKYVCTVQGRIGFKGYKSSDLVMEGEGALVLGATHITRDHKIDITEPVFLSWEKYYESPEIMVKQGDVVFTQRGVYLGKVALIDRDYKDVTINPSLILLKENLINSGYLTFYLTSHYIRKTIELISSNTAIPMISQENLSNFYCLVPPDKEQEEIFDFVNKSNSKIDLTISQIEKEIELMQEYRTALISEVVTGKIKVTA